MPPASGLVLIGLLELPMSPLTAESIRLAVVMAGLLEPSKMAPFPSSVENDACGTVDEVIDRDA